MPLLITSVSSTANCLLSRASAKPSASLLKKSSLMLSHHDQLSRPYILWFGEKL